MKNVKQNLKKKSKKVSISHYPSINVVLLFGTKWMLIAQPKIPRKLKHDFLCNFSSSNFNWHWSSSSFHKQLTRTIQRSIVNGIHSTAKCTKSIVQYFWIAQLRNPSPWAMRAWSTQFFFLVCHKKLDGMFWSSGWNSLAMV